MQLSQQKAGQQFPHSNPFPSPYVEIDEISSWIGQSQVGWGGTGRRGEEGHYQSVFLYSTCMERLMSNSAVYDWPPPPPPRHKICLLHPNTNSTIDLLPGDTNEPV